MSNRKITGKAPDSVDEWIEGSTSPEPTPANNDVKEPKEEPSNNPRADIMTAPPPPPRVQKNIRLRKDLAEKLTREALDLTLKHGVKVHEGSIVDFLLEQRYGDSD